MAKASWGGLLCSVDMRLIMLLNSSSVYFACILSSPHVCVKIWQLVVGALSRHNLLCVIGEHREAEDEALGW